MSQLNFEGKTKAEVAIERIRMFEPPEGYYLAFSGGKDSVVLLHLAQESGVKFDAHYNLTTVDPPELVQFVRRYHPEIQEHHPKRSMWQLIEAHHVLPTRMVRYCCSDLKEIGGKNRMVLTGIRWAESVRRANRKMCEHSKQGSFKRFVHPIIDWSDDDVWLYIKAKGVPYCRLYDEGFKRIGCLLCPMIDGQQLQDQIERYPKVVKAWRSATHRAWMARTKHDGKFQDADEYFEWWLSRKGLKEAEPSLECQLPFGDV